MGKTETVVEQLRSQITEYCKNKGMTNKSGIDYIAFAAECGLTGTTIYNIMNDNPNPTIGTVMSITEITGGRIVIG